MGEIAPEEQFLPLSTIFYYLRLDFYVKIGIRFSLRDKRLFEITEVEITRVDCNNSLFLKPHPLKTAIPASINCNVKSWTNMGHSIRVIFVVRLCQVVTCNCIGQLC